MKRRTARTYSRVWCSVCPLVPCSGLLDGVAVGCRAWYDHDGRRDPCIETAHPLARQYDQFHPSLVITQVFVGANLQADARPRLHNGIHVLLAGNETLATEKRKPLGRQHAREQCVVLARFGSCNLDQARATRPQTRQRIVETCFHILIDVIEIRLGRDAEHESIDRRRRCGGLSAHRRLDERRVCDAASEHAQTIHALRQREYSLRRPVIRARLVSDDSAQRRRPANRAAGVAAERHRRHSGRHCNRRTMTRPAGHARGLRVTRIPRQTVRQIDAAHREFGREGFAQKHAARALQCGDKWTLRRHQVTHVDLAAGIRNHATHTVQILQRDRQAHQWPEIDSSRAHRIDRGGAHECAVVVDVRIGSQARLQRIDAPKDGLGYIA